LQNVVSAADSRTVAEPPRLKVVEQTGDR
jgi:hypothetical protein